MKITADAFLAAVRRLPLTPAQVADGRIAAVAGDAAYVRNVGTAAPIAVCKGHKGSVAAWAIAFTPRSKRLITGGTDKTIRLWQMP